MFTKLIFDIDNTVFNLKNVKKKHLITFLTKIEELFLILKKK